MENLCTNITFETFEEAVNVQKQICRIKRMQKYVTYADFLALRNPFAECPDIYEKYGWFDIAGMKVEFDYDTMHYVLEMPQIIRL